MTTMTIEEELAELEARARSLRAARSRAEEEARRQEYARKQAEEQELLRRRKELETDPQLIAARQEADRLHAEWHSLCEEGRRNCHLIYDDPYGQGPAARKRAEELVPLTRAAFQRYNAAADHALRLEGQLRQQFDTMTKKG